MAGTLLKIDGKAEDRAGLTLAFGVLLLLGGIVTLLAHVLGSGQRVAWPILGAIGVSLGACSLAYGIGRSAGAHRFRRAALFIDEDRSVLQPGGQLVGQVEFESAQRLEAVDVACTVVYEDRGVDTTTTHSFACSVDGRLPVTADREHAGNQIVPIALRLPRVPPKRHESRWLWRLRFSAVVAGPDFSEYFALPMPAMHDCGEGVDVPAVPGDLGGGFVDLVRGPDQRAAPPCAGLQLADGVRWPADLRFTYGTTGLVVGGVLLAVVAATALGGTAGLELRGAASALGAALAGPLGVSVEECGPTITARGLWRFLLLVASGLVLAGAWVWLFGGSGPPAGD